MHLTSADFSDHDPIPREHTCLGTNTPPTLYWDNHPAQTKSLVLTLVDLDARPRWVHWLVYNLPPEAGSVAAGSLPGPAQLGLANNDSYGYEGPCPKYFAGTHRYLFRLYALDTFLDLPQDSDEAAVLAAAEGHILAHADLTGTFQGSL